MYECVCVLYGILYTKEAAHYLNRKRKLQSQTYLIYTLELFSADEIFRNERVRKKWLGQNCSIQSPSEAPF